MPTTKQQQQRSDRLNKLEALRNTDQQAFIRELYATCDEEYYPAGFTALHDKSTDQWYDLSGNKLNKPRNRYKGPIFDDFN